MGATKEKYGSGQFSDDESPISLMYSVGARPCGRLRGLEHHPFPDWGVRREALKLKIVQSHKEK
jgi:hypothetical protein